MGMIEINRRPSRRDLLWFGAILPVFFGILGAVLHFRFGAHGAALGIWLAGAAVTAIFFALPPLRIPAYLAWMHLFFPLGWTVSHIVLLMLYYGVATPTAFLLRVFRHDPMARSRDPEASTYWTERRQEKDPARYFRQF